MVNLAIVKFITGWRDIARIHENKVLLFKRKKLPEEEYYLGTDGRKIIEFILKLVH
jgi:hypothetical protein